MADSVGDLFVRIRPAPGSQAAFESEAAGPVAAAGKNLGKIFLTAFAVGGIAETIKGVVTAATEHQAAFAVLNQTTKDAGASNEIYGQSIESLLEKEARLKGFTDEDLASSFVRLVSATKDSKEAFNDLGLAEDVARARHIDLANAALAISKAEQGSATALQRLGIVVPSVTTAVDTLKTAHENAIISGAKFTDGQKQEYAQALLNAAAQDKAATRVQDLAVIRQRFGGDAATFANTASGQFARLQADFHQFEVAIGTDLLPSLDSAAEGLGAFFTKAKSDPGVRSAFTQIGDDARTVLTDIKDVAETVGPPLLSIARAADDVVSAIGGPEILAAIAAYKGLILVEKAGAAASAFYAKTLAAGRGEAIADTSAQGKLSASITANAEALQAQAATASEAQTRSAAALAANTESINAQTAATERLAQASEQADLATSSEAAIGPTEGLGAAATSATRATSALGDSAVFAAGAEQGLSVAVDEATASLAAQILQAEAAVAVASQLGISDIAPVVTATPDIAAASIETNEAAAVAGIGSLVSVSEEATVASQALSASADLEASSLDAVAASASAAAAAISEIPGASVAPAVAETVAPSAGVAAVGVESTSSVGASGAIDAEASALGRLSALTGEATVSEASFSSALRVNQGALAASTLEVDAQASALARLVIQKELASGVVTSGIESVAAAPVIPEAAVAERSVVAPAVRSAAVEEASVTPVAGVADVSVVPIEGLTAATDQAVAASGRLAASQAVQSAALSEAAVATNSAALAQRSYEDSLLATQGALGGAEGRTVATPSLVETQIVRRESVAPSASVAPVADTGATDALAAASTKAAASEAEVAAGASAEQGALAILGAEMATLTGETDSAASAQTALGSSAAAATPEVVALGSALAGATADQIAYRNSLLAGAPVYAEIVAGEDGVAAALAKSDAARAASIAESSAAVAANERQVASLAELTVAEIASASAAQRAGVASLSTVGYFSRTGVAAEEAGTEVEAGAGALSEFGSGLLALAGGPVTVGIAAVAGLAAGIVYLVTRENAATAATHNFESAISGLASAINSASQGKLTLQADQITLAQEKAALATSKLSHSSLEYRAMLNEEQQTELRVSEDKAALSSALGKQSDAYQTATDKAEALIAIEERAAVTGAVNRRALALDPSAVGTLTNMAVAANSFAVAEFKAADAIKGQSPLLSHNEDLLAEFADEFQKFPSKKTLELLLDNKDVTASLREVLDGAVQQAAIGGQQIGAALDGGAVRGIQQGAPVIISAAQEAAKEAAAAAAAEAKLNATIDPLKLEVQADRTDLAQLESDATDIATQGAQALAAAIQQAKSNLDSIGQSIASSLATYINKPLTDAATKIQDAEAKLSLLNDKTSLAQLGEEVILPGDKRLSTDPQKAIAQLEALQKTKKSPALDAYILQFRSLALQVEGDKNHVQQNAANLINAAARSRLANLTDLFNTHRISQETLEKDITALLEKNGLTAKTARTRGASFADTLAGELAGLKEQATALSTGPNDTSSGLIPSITRPIDTLNQTQKQLASNASEQRAKQLAESKTQTKILNDIHSAQAASKFTNSLDHNPGVKTERSKRLVGVGG